jgi:hypothetical protein
LFVVCLINCLVVRWCVSEIDFAPGVGQKLLGFDRAIPLANLFEKFLEVQKPNQAFEVIARGA